eukprot:3312309-Lingulodinium_polyedra.AAC.1
MPQISFVLLLLNVSGPWPTPLQIREHAVIINRRIPFSGCGANRPDQFPAENSFFFGTLVEMK